MLTVWTPERDAPLSELGLLRTNRQVNSPVPKQALWKSAIIAATVLLVMVGLIDVLFNLPIVTGDAPQ